MKTFSRVAITVLAIMSIQACVDKDYDLDNLNNEAVFHVPPVPVGTVDTAWFKSNIVEVPVPPGMSFSFALRYVMGNLFTSDVIEKFFFEGAGDVSLDGKIDIVISSLNQDVRITTLMSILDENEEPIEDITIENGLLTNSIGQPFKLGIKGEHARYMAGASGVEIIFLFENISSISLDRNDYLLIKDLVLKTGGMFIDLSE
jgi:hypothetical protein